jgi:hypothetical protein
VAAEHDASDLDDPAFRDAVQRTAYFLWEQDGRPDGRHLHYWQQALETHRRQRNFDEWLKDAPEAE